MNCMCKPRPLVAMSSMHAKLVCERRYNEDVANGLTLAPPSPESASTSGTVQDVLSPGSSSTSSTSGVNSWFHDQCARSSASAVRHDHAWALAAAARAYCVFSLPVTFIAGLAQPGVCLLLSSSVVQLVDHPGGCCRGGLAGVGHRWRARSLLPPACAAEAAHGGAVPDQGRQQLRAVRTCLLQRRRLFR